ncbi:hypothetical protein [Streptomyces spectabilis]|uniref:DUF4926 domain-containing protein n=1 Tax=Streptomyces spectabilis TaxID=68270 RepID=A0A7W8B2C5_STRST|nr:hypothetical protein [Streptomyces spectabilis]MBB5109021.1 hypothetical protein [Streptomyces spectabilis]GGV50704.1 hypothetical protein GCM10010245_79930 [Streptomyces spectabilis]
MKQTELAPGMPVRTSFADPGLPEGTAGTVVTVYDDLGDGVGVRLSNGKLINVMAHGLDSAARPGRERDTPVRPPA